MGGPNANVASKHHPAPSPRNRLPTPGQITHPAGNATKRDRRGHFFTFAHAPCPPHAPTDPHPIAGYSDPSPRVFPPNSPPDSYPMPPQIVATLRTTTPRTPTGRSKTRVTLNITSKTHVGA